MDQAQVLNTLSRLDEAIEFQQKQAQSAELAVESLKLRKVATIQSVCRECYGQLSSSKFLLEAAFEGAGGRRHEEIEAELSKLAECNLKLVNVRLNKDRDKITSFVLVLNHPLADDEGAESVMCELSIPNLSEITYEEVSHHRNCMAMLTVEGSSSIIRGYDLFQLFDVVNHMEE